MYPREKTILPIIKRESDKPYITKCEYCGLRYNNIKNKNIHQIYYCMGRDLSLEKSLARFKNNVKIKKYSSSSTTRNISTGNLGSLSQSNLNAFDETDRTMKFNYKSNLKFENERLNESKNKISNLKVFVVRLKPNQDLNKELDKFVQENGIKAGFIMSCVGSLTRAMIKMAYNNQESNEVKVFKEHLEILSLAGTVSSSGGHHLHISLSNKEGQVFGGHVYGELNVFTTAEVVIGECTDLSFKREYDKQSGYDELVINYR